MRIALLLVVIASGCTQSNSNCSYGKSQPASAPCCLEHGVDACGANLTCAALDGRTQPTCYLEHSRTTGQGCTADIQCASYACSSSGVCKALPGENCTAAVGCGPGPSTELYYCGSSAAGMRCVMCPRGSTNADCFPPGADLGGIDLAPRNCIGPEGNSMGVGKFCDRGADCAGTMATFCSTMVDPSMHFCTKQCSDTNPCGENATCTMGGIRFCQPMLCM